jgi:hypothetical protein
VKPKDKVLYAIPGDEERQWTISSIWNTNTEDGFMACLFRTDSSKKLGIDRCNAQVKDLEHA